MATVEPTWDGRRAFTGAAVHAPWWPVGLTIVAAIAATASASANAFLRDSVSVPQVVAGYVVGAIATTALAATYRALRNARRRNPRFRVQRSLDRTAATAMGLGFTAGLANAVLLATELAK